jgi:hypothetical protein
MLIALCSVKGSPGVTTMAVALAAQWPEATSRNRLVAEVDPAGGDLAMRFGLPSTPGLVSLAAAARRRRDPAVVWEHTQALTGAARVLLAPPGGAHARAALHTLATAQGGSLLQAAARDTGSVVLADCGRIDPGSLVEAIARRADALVVLTGTRGEDLAHVAACLHELARWTPRPGLLLSGQGYPTSDIERELGVPAIGRIPHDPAAADILTGHRSHPVRGRGVALARSVAALARTLATPPSPARPPPTRETGAVPGVAAQPMRQPGGVVPALPASGPHPAPSTGTPPTVTDHHRNGHLPITVTGKKEPPA